MPQKTFTVTRHDGQRMLAAAAELGMTQSKLAEHVMRKWLNEREKKEVL